MNETHLTARGNAVVAEELAWRTEGARARGEPWVFSVPTLDEFDAIRSASSHRRYPHGTEFRPRWAKSRYAVSGYLFEPTLRYPIDELPPGVFGLSGGVSEWTTTFFDEAYRLRWTIGGSWTNSDPQQFAVDYKKFIHEDTATAAWGFRLVARRVQ